MKLKKLMAAMLAAAVTMSASGTVLADTMAGATDAVYEDVPVYEYSDTYGIYPVQGGNLYYDGYAIVGTNYTITSAYIPEQIDGVFIRSIVGKGFSYCSDLAHITIPNTVTNIGTYAFRCCYSLPSINIPSSVTSIGDAVFEDCGSLTDINVDSANTNYCSVDGVLYSKDMTELICSPAKKANTTYTIPNSVTSIKRSAFYDCRALTDITIPSSVTSIEDNAFEYCTGLTSITIPNGVTSIEWRTFYGCTGLTSVTIPSSVTSIEYNAFWNCDQTKLVLYVEAGSYAEQWAKENDFITSTDQPAEPTTEYVTVFGKAYSPDAVVVDSDNIIDYSRYADKEIIVHYNISNAEATPGIYSYDTLINYNPEVVEMTGVYIPTSVENYAVYIDEAENMCLPYDKDAISTSINKVPQATDDKYADILTSSGAVNELTAAQLGRVELSNSISTAFTNGTLASFVFKVKGEGDTSICADFSKEPFAMYDNPDIVTSFESLSANIIVRDIDDSLNNNGNINLDESISANDAAILLQKALDLTFKTPCEEAYPDTYISISDVNGDGIITAADSASILQRALDSSYKFAID